MWFKNLQPYRVAASWAMTADELAEALAKNAFTPPSCNEFERCGWDKVRPDGGLVHVVNKQMLIVLTIEKKVLPAAAINKVVKERAAEMEESQGFAPGKKALKELKERVTDELLPRALSTRTSIRVWIDPCDGWLVVDAAAPAKADLVVKHLLKVIDRMPLESWRVQRSPVAMMTMWLQEGHPCDHVPYMFTIDRDAVMRATGEGRAQIAYKNHTLDPDDLKRHIATGKQCTSLAMTWGSKISFVLTEALAIKRVKALDVLNEKDAPARNADERFDADFMLMTGELAKMLGDVTEALGGVPGVDEFFKKD
jgi:recombination associated protein RdgC